MKYLLICLLFPIFSSSQCEKSYYSIYSEVLDYDLAAFYGNKKDLLKQLVLITDFKPGADMFSGSIINTFSKDTLSENDDWAFNYIDGQLKFIIKTEPDLRKAFKKLITISDDYLLLEPEKFVLKNKFSGIVGMSHKRFNSFFNKGRAINKSWVKLKSDYVFEFSKIACMGDFAVLYFGRHCGGLCGSGDVFILKKKDDIWYILGKLNEWVV